MMLLCAVCRRHVANQDLMFRILPISAVRPACRVSSFPALLPELAFSTAVGAPRLQEHTYLLKWLKRCTDKKENNIFLIYKEIQKGALQTYITNGSSYMTKYLRISSYIRKPFLIYDFATAPFWISLFMRKI
jgi:hypothetical protein